MTNFKSSGSYIVVLSIFAIHLVNSAHILNDTCVAGAGLTVTSPFTKMKASL